MSNPNQRSTAGGILPYDYPAVVVDTKHPDGLYMVRVRIPGLWDSVLDDDLPWADFLLPLGAKPNAGHAVPVEKGDEVVIKFPRRGDSRYPRIIGSIYHAPDGKSNLPDEVDGNGFDQKRAAGEPTPPVFGITDDIYSRFNLIVHKPSKGGICLTDKNTGAAIELTPKGEIVLHAEAGMFQSATSVTIKASEAVRVEAKSVDLVSQQGVNVTAKSYTFKCDGNFAIDAGGTFQVKAANADFKLGG